MINKFTKKRAGGFTLIELLVVVSIIGLLASIVVVSLGGSRVESRNTKRTADLRQIQQALELCYNDRACGDDSTKNDYPALTGTCSAITNYMAQAPVDPINSGQHVYTCYAADQRYCLSAKIEASGGGGGGDWTWVRQDGTLTGQAAAAAGTADPNGCSASSS